MTSYPPGFYVNELESAPRIEGVSVEASGMVGVAERGPVDKTILCFSEDDYKRQCGGYMNGAPAPMAVKDYYDQGARPLYFSRVVGAGAGKSAGDIKAVGGILKTIDLEAANEGEWGDKLILVTQKAGTVLTTATAAIGYDIIVSSVTGFQLGDVIKVGGAGPFFIVDITPSTKTLRLSAPVGAIVALGAVVSTGTFHKSRTTLAATIPNPAAATQMRVSAVSNIGIGDILLIYVGTVPTSQILLEVKVTKVNGTYIDYTLLNSVIATLTSIPIGAWITSVDFQLDVVYENDFKKSYQFLSLEEEDKEDHVDVRLGATGSENSLWIIATDSVNAEVLTWEAFRYPAPESSKGLTGGLEGAAPTDDDYLGLNTAKTYTHGLKLFDGIIGLPQVGIPGVTTATVLKGGYMWALGRGVTIFVGDMPFAIDTHEEAIAFREVTLNVDNSQATLYMPWHYDRNPDVPGALVLVPPSGRILGITSEVSARRGVNKAPANEPYTTAVKLAFEVEESALAILNEAGINIIRTLPGRGIRPYGARTLATKKDGKHFVPVRRTLNYAKDSIRNIGNLFTFEPITEDLWRQIEGAVGKFFRTMWMQGMLFPRRDFSRAAFVRVDGALNPDDVVMSGRVNGKAGIRPTPPAELIWFDFSLYEGGAEFQEL